MIDTPEITATREGHKMASELWECYLVGPESGPDPAEWATELNRLLA